MDTIKNTSIKKEYVPPHISIVMIPAASLLAASNDPPGDNVNIDYDPTVDADGGGLSKYNHYTTTFEQWE